MSDDVRAAAKRSAAELVALAGLLILTIVVPLAPLDVKVAGYRIADAVTFLLPLAVVAAYPFMRRLGAARLPALPLELPGLVFLALALPSVLLTVSRGGAALAWIRYALYFALAIVSAAVLRRRENRRAVLWAFAATALATAGIAAVQFFRPSAADLAFTGPGEPTRVFATFVNPNFYGEYLVLAIAVGMALFFIERSRFARLAAGVLLAAAAIALVMTYTRGSWLALAVGVAAGAALVDFRLLWAVLGAGGVLLVVVPSAWERLLSVFTVEGTSSQRIWLWSEALEVIREHPLAGVGIGEYAQYLERTRGVTPDLIGDITGAHDSYLQLAAEIGLAGGLAFVWVVLSVVAGGFRNLRALSSDAVERGVNAALTVGLVAFAANALVSNSFQHPQAAVFFWMLAGMQAAAVHGASPVRFRPLTGSRMSRIVFGNGAAIAPDLADWEVKAD